MHIEVTRSGGFAAIERHACLDTDGHPDESRLTALTEAALTPAPDRPAVPDGFLYTITVGTRSTRCADPHLTAAQRTLIQRVLGEGA